MGKARLTATPSRRLIRQLGGGCCHLSPIANGLPPTCVRDHVSPNDQRHIGHSDGACAHNGHSAIHKHDRSNGGIQPPKHVLDLGPQERLRGVVEVGQGAEPAHKWHRLLAADPIQHSNRRLVVPKVAAIQRTIDLR